MAIIKCPECGRQISENAPVCPNCGIEIKGKIIRCPQCGEVYFNDQEVCPNCHHITYKAPARPTPDTSVPAAKPVEQTATTTNTSVPAKPAEANEEPKKKNNSVVILLIALTISLLLGGCFFYFYNNAKSDKELQAYEYALGTNDPLVLQTYLDNNRDAPKEHRDAITAKLNGLKQQDNDWQNAVHSGSKTALEEYVKNHPDSEHLTEANHLIDSIDWAGAQVENSLTSLQAYIDAHTNGEHVTEANNAIKQIKSKTVQPEEKSTVVSALRRFFQSINSKEEERLQSSVAPVMSNFLGKSDATRADVATFLHKIYKEEYTNMNWRLKGDYQISKREVGEDRYEYSVKYSADQEIELGEGEKQTARYQLTSVINPDGQISAMTMSKLEE